MNTTFKLLNKITTDGTVDVTDFYSITFTKYEVSLQGRLEGSLLKKHKEQFNLQVDESGHVGGSALIDGVSVRVILT